MLEAVSTTLSSSWSHQVQPCSFQHSAPNKCHPISKCCTPGNVAQICEHQGISAELRPELCRYQMHTICEAYDSQSGVPHGTTAHSTRPDIVDVIKVVNTVLKNTILQPTPGRKHDAFPNLHLDPLCNWDMEKTKTWIERKKKTACNVSRMCLS